MNIYFDTNIYRKLFHDKSIFETIKIVENIKKLECDHNIKPFAHIFVITELLSHLNDPSDHAFKVCRNSALGLWKHCLYNNKFGFVWDSDNFFSDYFFKKIQKESDSVYNKCVGLLEYIYDNPQDYELINIREELIGINSAINLMEELFIKRYKKYIENTDPTSEGWVLYGNSKAFRKRNLRFISSDDALKTMAKLEVKKIANHINAMINNDDVEKFSKILYDNFKLHLQININILKKLIVSGCDLNLKNRANWFWDMLIASCVQTGNTINPDRFTLVTSDNDILTAAEDCGCHAQVLNYDEYFFILK